MEHSIKLKSRILSLAIVIVIIIVSSCNNDLISTETTSISERPVNPIVLDNYNNVNSIATEYPNETSKWKTGGKRIPNEMLEVWDFSQIKEKVMTENSDNTARLICFLDSINDNSLKEAYISAYALITVGYRDFDDFVNRELLNDYYGNDYESTDSERGTLYDENNLLIGKESGYTYASVYNAFINSFTEEYALEILKEMPLYCYGVELYYSEASNSRELCYAEYTLIRNSGNRVIILETCYKLDNSGNKTETIIYRNENSFILTDDGWRCEKFCLKNIFDSENF